MEQNLQHWMLHAGFNMPHIHASIASYIILGKTVIV